MFGLRITKSITFIYQIKYYTGHTLHNYCFKAATSNIFISFFFCVCIYAYIYFLLYITFGILSLSYFALFFLLT